MRQSIPDLRATPEITLEHCSVLLEHMGKTLEILDGQPGYQVAEMINPFQLLHHYEDHFQPEEFNRLFQTEYGRGVLIGCFVQKLLDSIRANENESED